MKNKEFYKDKIFDAACKYKNLAVDKETGEICKCPLTLCNDCALSKIMVGSCVDAWTHWLEQEHIEPVLDDAEKRYLESVVRPFKNRVKSITKRLYSNDHEYIHLEIKSIYEWDYELMNFPLFVRNKMYQRMETGKEYTIKELGLFENE